MNDHNMSLEQVSALVDGQLQGDDLAQAVEQVCGHAELLNTWHAYHVVGEVLRSGQHVPGRDSGAFLAAFRERLSLQDSRPAPAVAPVPRIGRRPEAANEPVFRWKLVAGLASLAAAAAIGWNWVGVTPAPVDAQLAQGQPSGAAPVFASAVQPAAGADTASARVLIDDKQQPQVMLRDPRLDALLEAHQQAGGASHMPSGFLRNATFEGQSR